MTITRPLGAAFRLSNPALAAALERLNQRTQAAARQRLGRLRSVSSAIAAYQRATLPKYFDLLKARHPLLHADLLALQLQAQNPAGRLAGWDQAVASFQARHGSAFTDLQGMFPDTRPHYLPQFFTPPVRRSNGQAPASSPSSSAPSLARKTVTIQPPGWNGIAVGDPSYEDGQNLVDCDGASGSIHVKTHTRVLFDTFGLTNTGGCGAYVDIDAGYRQAEISVEYDYSGEVGTITPVGEAAASVDLVYDVTDIGSGDSVDHFESTLRGLLNFPPSSISQYSDFDSGGSIITSTLSIDTQRYPNGYSYLVSVQYRCSAQAFGGAEGNAFVRGDLLRINVTMIP